MDLEITYSLSKMKENLSWYFKSLKDMEQEGYEVLLPEGTDVSEDSKEEVIEKAEKQFNPEEYEEAKEELSKAYSEIEEKFTEYIKNTFNNRKNTIKAHLTEYGPGGSYHPPNEVIVCFKRFSTNQMLSTLLHEVIHLYIHPYIKKYEVKHWQKERIVDLLLNDSDILKEEQWQSHYNHVEEKIDKLFKKHFHESKERFFKEIKQKTS